MQARRLLYVSILLPLTLLLGACGEMSSVKESGPVPNAVHISRAAQLMEQHDYSDAARLYQDLAAKTPGPEGYGYLLDAADAALQGQDTNTASKLITQLAGLPLTPIQQQRLLLQQSELSMARNQPENALQALRANPPPDGTPPKLAQRYYRDLANAYQLNGNLLESAKALIKLDSLLSDPTQRLQVQTQLLRSLTLLNPLVLTNLQPSPPGVLGGWMQLALLVKKYADAPDILKQQEADWRSRFPNHPALPELLSNYRAQLQAQVQHARHIAVLLPQSGPYAAAADALRDGILISLYQMPPEQRPTVRFYDSTDPQSVWPLLNKAASDGADVVIGPLQKDAVMQLARAGTLPLPVLALNQVETDNVPPPNLYMFALTPESEGRHAAERIWQDKLRQPLLLVPQGEWGERIANAFDQRWQQLTGSAAEYHTYNPNSPDHSKAIESLLNLNRSHARDRQLQRWFGRKLMFEPRRRADVDAIFIAADPQQAQSLRPQLQFHHAGDLPVYATAQAWNGTLTSQQVVDMQGIMLADAPLLVDKKLRQTLGQAIPTVNGPLIRLYAMGMDAFNLTANLKRLQGNSYESLDGQTGILYMVDNVIKRQTLWLRLGDPVQILGYAARLNLTPSGALPLTSGTSVSGNPGTDGSLPDNSTPGSPTSDSHAPDNSTDNPVVITAPAN